MDPNNPNYGRNFNFPYYPNPQNSSNTPPFDPNIINNPQFQAALQWFGSQPRPMNPTYQNYIPFQQSSENNPSFPVSEHFTQQMENSPGGEGSYNATPTSELRATRHLDDIEEVDVEAVPRELFVAAKEKTRQKAAWSVAEDNAIVSGYINSGGDVVRNTNTRKAGLWMEIFKHYEIVRAENPREIRERTSKSMQQRWDHINGKVSKWVEVYSYELRHKKSGESDADVEKRAFEVYQKSNNGKPFQLMHCFNIMRKFDKWSPEIMQVPCESGGSNKRSGPDTPIEEAATPTRPDGIKKTKRKGKEAATTSMSSVNLEGVSYTLC